jgi:L-ribulose-5-phosphate 4-epimerase
MTSQKFKHIAELAYSANMKIPMHDLAILTWGNASASDPEQGIFAIKPSGIPYESLTVDSMVIVDYEGRVVDGPLSPSSDTATHAVLYKAWPKLRGIVHTHSPFATSWAQACRPIPLQGTTHADHTTHTIPCTPYLSEEDVQGNYELETGNLILRTMEELELDPYDMNMILVAGHGPFSWGVSAEKAIYSAIVLEEICKMALYTRILNPAQERLPAYIIEKHWQRKHGEKAYYGQDHR